MYESNPLQNIIVSGSYRPGCALTTAECLFEGPAYMWGGRKVERSYDDKFEVNYNAHFFGQKENDGDNHSKISFGECLLLGIPYTIASVVAVGLMGVGMAFKQIAFCQDPTAREYDQLAANHIHKMTEVQESIRGKYGLHKYDLPTHKQSFRDVCVHLKTKLEKAKEEQGYLIELLKMISEDIDNRKEVRTTPIHLVYRPVECDGIIVDYEMAAIGDYKSILVPKSRNKLLGELEYHKGRISALEKEIAEIDEGIEKYKELSREFVEDAKSLFDKESDSLLI